MRYVVDPVFREQFVIAKPTPRYASLLSSLPDVFIGPFENLTPLVLFLCAEMAASFKETGGSCLPPWRCTTSMLSKWRTTGSGAGSGLVFIRASSSFSDSSEGWPGSQASQGAYMDGVLRSVPLLLLLIHDHVFLLLKFMI